jgi:pilus assembly protein CpaC
MIPILARRAGKSGTAFWQSLAVAAWWACAGTADAADPPAPPCPAATACPTPLAVRAPDPPKKAEELDAFIKSLSANDAAIEVIVEQGRILTTAEDITAPGRQALVAVGDPTVLDFSVLNTRQLRIVGQRIGVTDLAITAASGKIYSFEVRVVADLTLLRVKLCQLFPDARLKVAHLRDHLVVQGEARDTAQVTDIINTIRAYLESVRSGELRKVTAEQGAPLGAPGVPVRVPGRQGGAARPGAPGAEVPPAAALPEQVPIRGFEAAIAEPRIINLIRVPGSQQVLLKVRVAELNRTAMREIGTDWMWLGSGGKGVAGTTLGNGSITAGSSVFTPFVNVLENSSTVGGHTTVFGVFRQGEFQFIMNALRQNNLLKVLAEPNLVAMSGHRANFLAGGQFFIPVAQSATVSGGAAAITAQAVDFGVRLEFVSYILDGDVIRLTVEPEVSAPDFTVATTLVAGGSPVPGLNKRSAHTTVEMHTGETLAIAGLLQITLDGTTKRLPGLGDLPILGPFFSNTTSDRVEKELIILVTPYLAEPMNADQVGHAPGDEVKAPNDLEFYFLNRIEGRTGTDWRATTEYDDALHVLRACLKLHQQHVQGPFGFGD